MIENFKGKFLLLSSGGLISTIDNSDYYFFKPERFNNYVHGILDCDCYERVVCRSLAKYNISMLVDESGILKGKPINFDAWRLYSGFASNAPIVGDVLFCSECYQDFGEGFPEADFCFLNNDQINFLIQQIYRI